MSGADVDVTEGLNTIEDLTGYPVFPEGTKCSVARFNTREVWRQLHNKDDSYGVPYRLCIFSGIKNLDAWIGVHAGSHDSFKSFALFMDKVIEGYHGHKPEDRHISSDMDASKLLCPPFPQDEAGMILSTRIRVARNLEGYPFGSGVSGEQRYEIEEKVKIICSTFTGDLKGTYYPLSEMSRETQNQLVTDHFLFK